MKFRSANVNLYLNKLRAQGYEVFSVKDTKRPRSTTYELHNKEKGRKATVYKTVNSWLEITYSPL